MLMLATLLPLQKFLSLERFHLLEHSTTATTTTTTVVANQNWTRKEQPHV